MGTIDISYLSLGIGLLLLSIPLFYIWKFKTGLLRATLIGTARMIVQQIGRASCRERVYVLV